MAELKYASRFLRLTIKMRRDRASYYFSLREYYFCHGIPLIGVNETFITIQDSEFCQRSSRNFDKRCD